MKVRVLWESITYPESADKLLTSISANGHWLGLTKEILYTIIVQGAAHLSAVKVEAGRFTAPWALMIYK